MDERLTSRKTTKASLSMSPIKFSFDYKNPREHSPSITVDYGFNNNSNIFKK
jgi:hypothetical protein